MHVMVIVKTAEAEMVNITYAAVLNAEQWGSFPSHLPDA